MVSGVDRAFIEAVGSETWRKSSVTVTSMVGSDLTLNRCVFLATGVQFGLDGSVSWAWNIYVGLSCERVQEVMALRLDFAAKKAERLGYRGEVIVDMGGKAGFSSPSPRMRVVFRLAPRQGAGSCSLRELVKGLAPVNVDLAQYEEIYPEAG